jgi:hypothetical protein
MRGACLVASVATGLTLVASALAGWAGGGTGDAAAAAATLAAGPTPTATAPPLSLTVTVSWASAPLATGYVLTRRNAVGIPEAPGGTCAGVVAGTSCSETVLAGAYRYAVAVRRSGWTGPIGADGAQVTVPGL